MEELCARDARECWEKAPLWSKLLEDRPSLGKLVDVLLNEVEKLAGVGRQHVAKSLIHKFLDEVEGFTAIIDLNIDKNCSTPLQDASNTNARLEDVLDYLLSVPDLESMISRLQQVAKL